ncbi:MAG: aminopeptidase P family protein [Proteobacteria bacterium]|nr:aminopeptidase P family protein [Pseudomonadota bacterium]
MNIHAFDTSEFEHRLLRVQERMRYHRLDALVVTSQPNFRYFSGFDSQFWESPTRPWFLIVPAHERCIAVVPEIGAPVLATSWIDDIRTWPAPRPDDDGVSLLADALHSLPQRFARIGMEMGRESTVRMPLIDFLRLRERLAMSGTDVADGSACIWQVRNIKSPAEIAYIRQSCELVSAAFEELPSQLATGRTEQEVCRDLTMDILRRGAHAVPFLAAASGSGGYAQIISRPTRRVLHEGDVLIIDVGATINGYFCDFDRNYAFGKLSDPARRAQDAVWRATEAGIAAAVPGATTSDLWRTMTAILERAGMRKNNVGRVGHGLGLQLTEPPSNMADDHTVLEAGMVITIEPGMEYEDGKMIVHEENVVITPEGAELLTKRAPREMPTV